MTAERVVLVHGARTPVGSYAGSLADVDAHVLGATAARAALERSGVPAGDVDEVMMGCVGQVGTDAYNARRVALEAGLAADVPALTVNRLCGSGLQAIWSGAQAIVTGAARVVVAGGDESMSRMPFLAYGQRANARLGDRTLVDGTVAMLTDPFSGDHMGITAENVAERFDISRADQDAFALRSQRRAASEEAQAAFAEEIVPVRIGGRKPRTVDRDEHPRPDVDAAALARLRPVFLPEGTVTAGNASGVNDGGAAVVLAAESYVKEAGLTGLATLEHVVVAALEPEIMGYAPVPALRKLFAETGLDPDQVGTYELNEAFAAQALAVVRDSGIDPERTNPYGGAIALGHPIGATGAILALRVALDLQRRDLEYGIVALCIGGGQALAALFRRYPQ
ncbi:acetyl-CoA C-acetyltransferase [Raineyella antarctica]|uniref:Probable acetyl-CoA acetyltransferase n=1 Tax=Raineyella antarctica TaxID=1577474 RepID=A0A1G6GIL4_9ACTN|nr:thiolase family protein [Raineyella antarctica]SDB81595.1 acetyl-CoA C-acetyltransferase [Raineyella antarctica]